MKKCFKCGETKELSEFYVHKKMADGYLNKCKECTKKDVGKHRFENIDKIRDYDRKRGKLPHRVEQNVKRTAQYRKDNPSRYRCHSKLNNALRDGRTKRKPCAVCGSTERIEAHHFDYTKHLEVIWLCSEHHSAVHYPKDCG